MKRVLLIAAVLIAAVAMFTIQPVVAQGNHDKVDICHFPPGNLDNGHVISVDREAWENGHTPHNAHQYDYVWTGGACTVEPGPQPA